MSHMLTLTLSFSRQNHAIKRFGRRESLHFMNSVDKESSWFHQKVNNLINRNSNLDFSINTSPTQPPKTRISFLSPFINGFKSMLAIISLMIVMPSVSFARSSSSMKRSSTESSSPNSAAYVKILSKRNNKASSSSTVLEYPSATSSSDSSFMSNQKLQTIGIGLTVATVIISIVSDDDSKASKKSSNIIKNVFED